MSWKKITEDAKIYDFNAEKERRIQKSREQVDSSSPAAQAESSGHPAGSARTTSIPEALKNFLQRFKTRKGLAVERLLGHQPVEGYAELAGKLLDKIHHILVTHPDMPLEDPELGGVEETHLTRIAQELGDNPSPDDRQNILRFTLDFSKNFISQAIYTHDHLDHSGLDHQHAGVQTEEGQQALEDYLQSQKESDPE